MEQNKFEWDPSKATYNERKHGVGFLKAIQVFSDPLALTVFDKWHSDKEDRWFTIGSDHAANVLVLSHTYRLDTDSAVIRVI